MIRIQSVFKFLAVAVLYATFAACGSGVDKDYAFREADEFLSRGDVSGAKASVDKYFAEGDTTLLNWKDYCTAYVIYAMAYDASIDSDGSLSSSERCLNRALALNSDSTSNYMRCLPADRLSAVESVSSIINHLDEARKTDSKDLMEDHDIDPEYVHEGHDHGGSEGQE